MKPHISLICHIQKYGTGRRQASKQKHIQSTHLHSLIPPSAIAILSQDLCETLARASHKRREWVLVSALNVRGKSVLMVRDLMPITPNMTSLNVKALNACPGLFLSLPVPVSISQAAPSQYQLLRKAFHLQIPYSYPRLPGASSFLRQLVPLSFHCR